MKKFILLTLLLSFIYQNTSSFWIITSFYINQDFISENICVNRFDKIPVCNGKCFLQKELTADSDKERQIPNIKLQELQPLFYQTAFYQNAFVQEYVTSVIYPEYNSEFVTSKLVFSVFQPPELV
ncbi:MAG: hypothetical protein RSF68_01875 [Myroides sp.]